MKNLQKGNFFKVKFANINDCFEVLNIYEDSVYCINRKNYKKMNVRLEDIEFIKRDGIDDKDVLISILPPVNIYYSRDKANVYDNSDERFYEDVIIYLNLQENVAGCMYVHEVQNALNCFGNLHFAI